MMPVTSSATALGLALILGLLTVPVQAHGDRVWRPNEAVGLAGVFTFGSRGLMYIMMLGGGYGTLKDNHGGPVGVPGTEFKLVCLTHDYIANVAACPFTEATCVLPRRFILADDGGASPMSMQARCKMNGIGAVDATVTADFKSVSMRLETPPQITAAVIIKKSRGDLSGLWTSGRFDHECLVVAHDGVTDSVVVWHHRRANENKDDEGAQNWRYATGHFSDDGPGDDILGLDFHFSTATVAATGVVASNSSAVRSGTLAALLKEKTAHQLLPRAEGDGEQVHTVHMVFMNHLDVGYTEDVQVIDNEYLHDFYPLVRELAEALRAADPTGEDRLIYVTHPWLLSLFFDCPCSDATGSTTGSADCPALQLNNPFSGPLRCPTAAEVANLTDSIKRGDVVWHGGPFNWQAEALLPEVFEAGLGLAKKFDARFGKSAANNQSSIVLNLRDVVYMTRGVIPLLRRHGIKALTMGANGGNFPPQTPKLHRWLDLASGTDVMVAYHPYGYGGATTSRCNDPTVQCGDCAEAPNGVALCTAFRTDNSGPPQSVDEVRQALARLRQEYPGATVRASTFSAFFRDIEAVKDQLPVVTAEGGDNWIFGIASDPLKMMQAREIQRQFAACVRAGRPECAVDEPSGAIANMTRFLIKTVEHTWGMPGRFFLPGQDAEGKQNPSLGWGNETGSNHAPFWWDTYIKLSSSLLQTQPMAHAAASWAEQRFFNELAIRALEEATPPHPLAAPIRAAVDAMTVVVPPSVAGMRLVPANETHDTIRLGCGVTVSVGATGGFATLRDEGEGEGEGEGKGTGWASPERPLAAYRYRVYNGSDWNAFTQQFTTARAECDSTLHSNGAETLCKPSSSNYSEAATFAPAVTTVHVDVNASVLVVSMVMPDRAVERYGAPRALTLHAAFSRPTSSTGLSVKLAFSWFGKQPTMIGESSQLLFAVAPALAPPSPLASAWNMSKLGTMVDPEAVVNGGAQWNHAVDDGGVSVTTSRGRLGIVALDAPVFGPMTPEFPEGNALPAGYGPSFPADAAVSGSAPLKKGSVFGMASQMHNNAWNTNYPLWYPYHDPALCPATEPLKCLDQNARFRYELIMS